MLRGVRRGARGRARGARRTARGGRAVRRPGDAEQVRVQHLACSTPRPPRYKPDAHLSPAPYKPDAHLSPAPYKPDAHPPPAPFRSYGTLSQPQTLRFWRLAFFWRARARARMCVCVFVHVCVWRLCAYVCGVCVHMCVASVCICVWRLCAELRCELRSLGAGTSSPRSAPPVLTGHVSSLLPY